MSASVIDGVCIARNLEGQVRAEIDVLSRHNIHPSLALIQVGVNPASTLYIKKKCEKARDLGIRADVHRLSEDSDSSTLIRLIQTLNEDSQIYGIIVQLPLPSHWNSLEIISTIHPDKDVDGLTPVNLGLLMQGAPSLVPCTPLACFQLIQTICPIIQGLRAVVVGRSALVGKPLFELLTNANATVTLCHSKTNTLAQISQSADVLVSAIGCPMLITHEYIKPGAIVIDVGINRTSRGLCGDIDFESVKKVAGFITPVPGGVGPMTVINLFKNTVQATLNHHKMTGAT